MYRLIDLFIHPWCHDLRNYILDFIPLIDKLNLRQVSKEVKLVCSPHYKFVKIKNDFKHWLKSFAIMQLKKDIDNNAVYNADFHDNSMDTALKILENFDEYIDDLFNNIGPNLFISGSSIIQYLYGVNFNENKESSYSDIDIFIKLPSEYRELEGLYHDNLIKISPTILLRDILLQRRESDIAIYDVNNGQFYSLKFSVFNFVVTFNDPEKTIKNFDIQLIQNYYNGEKFKLTHINDIYNKEIKLNLDVDFINYEYPTNRIIKYIHRGFKYNEEYDINGPVKIIKSALIKSSIIDQLEILEL